MIKYDMDALDYIAKIADGGMRDAITLMDKCLAYSIDLTLESVIEALGVVDYQQMFDLTEFILAKDGASVIKLIESIHMSGKDLKQFVHTYMEFLLDLNKYSLLNDYTYISIPSIYKMEYNNEEMSIIFKLLGCVIKLNTDIKWETNPKPLIESALIMECE